jgi:hypothetical protein
MRTSLNNIKAIDDYLQHALTPGEQLLFEANILLNKELADDVARQRNASAMVMEYSRKITKAEIAAVQQLLNTAPQYRSFMQRIVRLFN